MTALEDSGERRRASEATPLICELIDEATVQGIAENALENGVPL